MAIMFPEVQTPSSVPAFAVPWFLYSNQDIEFRIVMDLKDPAKASLDELSKKWA